MLKTLFLLLLSCMIFISCASNKASQEKNKDIFTTDTGLEYKEVKIGSGQTPEDGSSVKINLIIYDEDDNVVEDSRKSKPVEFIIGKEQVISGLEDGVKTMKVGGKRILYIPPELGFGSRSVKNLPSDSFLIMEVELLEVK